MASVVGVRFRQAGKIYHFDCGSLEPKAGDPVIVETARGVEFGRVVTGRREISENPGQPLKKVLRLAEPGDIAKNEDNLRREKDAIRICKEKIRRHELEMKLIDCEYTFDNSKMLFYFTADGRVDFRELVKDLASVFHTRIELRQVGVRDETKILGGIGSCGRPLCCHTWLPEFVPVSIKMAKEQNLSLNTSKISGVCGRLMCCLKNEQAVYEELNRNLPASGDAVSTPDGLRGTVNAVNILRQLVKVVVELPNDEKEIREYPASELVIRSRKKARQAQAAAEKEKDREKRGRNRGKDAAKAAGKADRQAAAEPEEDFDAAHGHDPELDGGYWTDAEADTDEETVRVLEVNETAEFAEAEFELSDEDDQEDQMDRSEYDE